MRPLARALALAGAFACAACAAPPSTRGADGSLEGTAWVGAAKSDPAATPRLEFALAGRLAGFTGCNMMSGSYRIEGDRLDVLAATTKRACLGPGGEVEQRLLAVLADRPRWRVEGGRLVLTGEKGGSFELTAAAGR